MDSAVYSNLAALMRQVVENDMPIDAKAHELAEHIDIQLLMEFLRLLHEII